MQLVGIFSQIVLADLLGLPRPTGEEGFDGGYDFIIDGKRVDLKTMARNVDVQPHYVHNFVGYQLKYDCQYYLFASFNIERGVLTLCGVIDKQHFIDRSLHFDKGDVRYRDDGTSFVTRAPLYEIRQDDLEPLNSLEDLHEYLKK